MIAMSQKHWLLTISLTALVCLHSICPLYCAAVEQMSCGNEVNQFVNSVQSNSSCCHRDADSSSENENTSEVGNTCCLTNFDVILPEITYRIDYTPQTDEHIIIASVLLDSLVMIDQEQQLNTFSPGKFSLLPLTSNLSRRGPPYLLS